MKISIVIPVFNSENILEKLINKIESLNLINFEIILVDDYSKDNSWRKICELSKANEKIKGISLNKNYGQHNAIMAGLNYVKSEIIVIMDDDFQHPPESIKEMVGKIKGGYEICYTKYLERKHGALKIALSEMSNFITSLVINKPTSLYLSSFKCLTSNIKDELIKIKKPNIYLDIFLLNISKKITYININHQERLEGKTNYSFKKLFFLWLNLISNAPVNYFSLRGIILIFLKITIIPFTVYRYLLSDLNKIQFQIKNKTF